MTVHIMLITVSFLMYDIIEKLVPAERLNLDQTAGCNVFSSSFGGLSITKQSAPRLFCLFGVNEWCVKHLEWCMGTIGVLTWGSQLSDRLCALERQQCDPICRVKHSDFLGTLHERCPEMGRMRTLPCTHTHIHTHTFPCELLHFISSKLSSSARLVSA